MVRVNNKAKKFLLSLVEYGDIDYDSEWEFTAADGNALLGENGE